MELKKAFDEPTPEQLVLAEWAKYHSVEEIEAEINTDAQELFQRQRMFRPLWPWVFIYCLPREQKVGSIVLPEHEQNKTVHEGIVLATWQSFWRRTKRQGPYTEGGRSSAYQESALLPGDHVLFPHWAGVPISGYDTGKYRVVREEGEGCIQGVIEYADEPITEKLAEELRSFASENMTCAEAAAKLEERFLLVDRKASSVTISGR